MLKNSHVNRQMQLGKRNSSRTKHSCFGEALTTHGLLRHRKACCKGHDETIHCSSDKMEHIVSVSS